MPTLCTNGNDGLHGALVREGSCRERFTVKISVQIFSTVHGCSISLDDGVLRLAISLCNQVDISSNFLWIVL